MFAWVVPWAIILLAWAWMNWGPGWHRSIDDISPVRPSEWVTRGLNMLFLPGLFAMAALYWRKSTYLPWEYWVCHLVTGLIGWCLGYVSLLLLHIACDDNCVPSVPTYAAGDQFLRLMLLLCLAPAVAGLIATLARRTSRRATNKRPYRI